MFGAEKMFPVGAVIGGAEPTVEQRLKRLEIKLAEEREQRDKAVRELKAHMIERINQSASSAHRSTRREIDALAVAAVARPSTQQWIAIGLFVFGLILITVGALI